MRFGASNPSYAVLLKQIQSIETWASRNAHEARADRLKYWCFKVPAFACTLCMSIFAWNGHSGMIVVLGAIAALCIAIDSAIPRRSVHNIHKRAEHDLLRLANEIDTELDKIGTHYPPLSDSQLADRVNKILDTAKIERDRIGAYIKAAESALDDPPTTASASPAQEWHPEKNTDSVAVCDSRQLVDLLAKIASDSEGAKAIARRAGFPAEHLPEFKTAAGFWTAIVDQAANGRIDLKMLVEEAAQQFPHNSELEEHRVELAFTYSMINTERSVQTLRTPPSHEAASLLVQDSICAPTFGVGIVKNTHGGGLHHD